MTISATIGADSMNKPTETDEIGSADAWNTLRHLKGIM